MGAKIINRGRGPEIEGTRITVYDVFDYVQQGWHRDRIAALFRLSSRDIQAALDYIHQHQEEVTDHYRRILERQQQYQYPPAIAAKIAASRQSAQARLAATTAPRSREHTEQNDGRDHGGSQH
jgi:uncharacterized protein (DUF433 family)